MATYQVPVMYDGKKLIPGPRVSFQRQIQRSADGSSRQRGWKILLTGEIAAFAGSPRNDGTFWTASGYPPDETPSTNAAELRIRNLRNKLKAITDLFANDGKWFEVQPGDGSAPIKALITVANVNYSEGPWFNTVPFSIEMDASKVYFGSVDADYNFGTFQKDNMPEESWSIEPADEVGRTYRLTHTINASGRKMFDDDGSVLAEGWEVARAYILGPDDVNPDIAGPGAINLLGIDNQFLISAGVLDLNTFSAYNYVRSNQIDTASGRYSVTESWLSYNPDEVSPTNKQTYGKALEELTVETRYSSENGLYSVSVSGSITGLEERDNTTRTLISTRWQNAELRSNEVCQPSVLKPIAESYSTISLNPNPLATTITRNKVNGVVQYSISFDNRPSITTGYLSELYTVTLDNAADVFASIGVVGRPLGPILQSIGSTTQKSISISAEIVKAVAYGQPTPSIPIYNPLPDVLSIIGIPNQIFLASDQENWIPRLGRYSRRTTYVYQ